VLLERTRVLKKNLCSLYILLIEVVLLLTYKYNDIINKRSSLKLIITYFFTRIG